MDQDPAGAGMTVLSQLELRPRHLAVVRDLADPAEMHRTLMRAFPHSDGPSPRAAFGVLFRADPERKRVLVQSQEAPDWDQLPERYVVDAQSKEIDPALAAIGAGHELRFLLVANASRKVARAADEASRHSRRVELTDDEARHAWLAGQGIRSGFRLCGRGSHDGVRIDRVIPARPVGRQKGSRITVKAVRYEGLLTVTDPETFVGAIQSGLGPAKAYGCGLLSVAPV